MHLNKYIWYVKKETNLKNYGFEYSSGYYKLEILGKYRIFIREKDLRCEFVSMINEALVVFSQMINDDVIYYTKNQKQKYPKLLTEEEWEVIKKMRGYDNEV